MAYGSSEIHIGHRPRLLGRFGAYSAAIAETISVVLTIALA
jgi:hypothetical protein